MGAALTYDSLEGDAREAWLDALEADAADLPVPALALYAPLLAAESEAGPRRSRIEAAIAAQPAPSPDCVEPFALRGIASDGTYACVLVAPLYLSFVQILRCRYTPGEGFAEVQHDPMRHIDELGHLDVLDGMAIEPTPLPIVVEELAHAILAHRRAGRLLAPALASFAHLFAPDVS
jgi:hypothetical protein